MAAIAPTAMMAVTAASPVLASGLFFGGERAATVTDEDREHMAEEAKEGVRPSTGPEEDLHQTVTAGDEAVGGQPANERHTSDPDAAEAASKNTENSENGGTDEKKNDDGDDNAIAPAGTDDRYDGAKEADAIEDTGRAAGDMAGKEEEEANQPSDDIPDAPPTKTLDAQEIDDISSTAAMLG